MPNVDALQWDLYVAAGAPFLGVKIINQFVILNAHARWEVFLWLVVLLKINFGPFQSTAVKVN
jgi:hypothetical protein